MRLVLNKEPCGKTAGNYQVEQLRFDKCKVGIR